jgi:ribose 5-phosphate isomerase A
VVKEFTKPTQHFPPNGQPPESRRAKEAAGFAAAHHVQSGMLVGLGTGSTVAFFLQALGRRCRDNLQITGIASSQKTQTLAEREGIPLIDSRDIAFLDLTVDGADEIDSRYQMIKGGGGALLREKICASSSREMIVIVDAAKCVTQLGRHLLPVEIATFGATATLSKLERLGYRGLLRRAADGENFVTDNGNWIVDLDITRHPQDPRDIDRSLRSVVGVLETGFFFDVATRVIVGFEDGHVEEQQC